MKVFGKALAVLSVAMFGAMLAPLASADSLGAADTFAVLATTQVTNGATNLADSVITGNL